MPRNRLHGGNVAGFVARLTAIQAEAFRIGLYATGQKLHEATRQVGWEIAHTIPSGKRGGSK